jgi:hypothetical protein
MSFPPFSIIASSGYAKDEDTGMDVEAAPDGDERRRARRWSTAA